MSGPYKIVQINSGMWRVQGPTRTYYDYGHEQQATDEAAALNAAYAAGLAGEWQDIETAPRIAGKRIIVHIAYDEPDVTLGWWDAGSECWRNLGDDGPGDMQPTHWMPLPEPPRPTGSAQ